jgi:hypothetical protein
MNIPAAARDKLRLLRLATGSDRNGVLTWAAQEVRTFARET